MTHVVRPLLIASLLLTAALNANAAGERAAQARDRLAHVNGVIGKGFSRSMALRSNGLVHTASRILDASGTSVTDHVSEVKLPSGRVLGENHHTTFSHDGSHLVLTTDHRGGTTVSVKDGQSGAVSTMRISADTGRVAFAHTQETEPNSLMRTRATESRGKLGIRGGVSIRVSGRDAAGNATESTTRQVYGTQSGGLVKLPGLRLVTRE